MKIIQPSVKILKQEPGIEGIYKQIEQAGRACYASQHKIGEGTARPFVDMLIKRGHLAMLEHGAVYLQTPYDEWIELVFKDNPYSRAYPFHETGSLFVTTNLRVLVENDLMDLLKYVVEPGSMHDLRVTARFQCQIAISREYNRHRADSIAEQSTRFCNYSKERFGNEIKICLPKLPFERDEDSELLLNAKHLDQTLFRKYCTLIATLSDSCMTAIDYWLFANFAAEYSYMKLIELGWQAQQARTVLPLDTSTDLVHTAYISDWMHFFDLRCDNAAHPDARYLANQLRQMFLDEKYIYEREDE